MATNTARLTKHERLSIGSNSELRVIDLLRELGATVNRLDSNPATNAKTGDIRIVNFPGFPDLNGKSIEVKVSGYRDSVFFCKHRSSRSGSYGAKDDDWYPSGIDISEADYWLIYKGSHAYLISTEYLWILWDTSRDVRSSWNHDNDAPDFGRMVQLAPYRRPYLDLKA